MPYIFKEREFADEISLKPLPLARFWLTGSEDEVELVMTV